MEKGSLVFMRRLDFLLKFHIIKTVIVLMIVAVIAMFVYPSKNSGREIGKLDMLTGIVKELGETRFSCRPLSKLLKPDCVSQSAPARYAIISIEGYDDMRRPLLRSVKLKVGMEVPMKRYSFSDGSESISLDEMAILEQQ
ncbi:MAG: hypothetical protein ACRBHB_12325 [Arenicella sp.]